MNDSPFIAVARAGKNNFLRYVFSVFFVIFLVVSGSVVVAIALGLSGINPTAALTGAPALLYFTLNLALFGVVWLGLWLCLPRIHQRPFMTLVNPTRRFNWGRFWLGAGLWLAINIAYNLVFAVLKPGYYTWSLDLPAFLPYLLVGLLLFPIQAGAEELFFRGYLTQGLGLVNGWLGWLVPAVVFGLLHSFNPEVGAYGLLLTLPVYVGMGLLFGWITLRSGSLELALGVHILNNLYAGLLTRIPDSAIQTEALFTVEKYDALAEMLAFFACALIFVLIIEAILRRAPRSGSQGPFASLLGVLVAGSMVMRDRKSVV